VPCANPVTASPRDKLTIMPKATQTVEAGEGYPPRPNRARAVVQVGLLVMGWLIVAALGLVALLRLVAWDSLQPLIVLDALTQVVYLPAWVVAVGALIMRRWWLALAAGVRGAGATRCGSRAGMDPPWPGGAGVRREH